MPARNREEAEARARELFPAFEILGAERNPPTWTVTLRLKRGAAGKMRDWTGSSKKGGTRGR